MLRWLTPTLRNIPSIISLNLKIPTIVKAVVLRRLQKIFNDPPQIDLWKNKLR